MREIKFRVWDMENKMMYGKPPYRELFITNIEILDNKSGKRGIAFGDYLYPFLQDRYVLMQYTGLKDKNGKAIYEGDVVSVGNVAGIVEYEDEVAGFFAKVPSSEHFPFIASCKLNNRQIEVIGNVWEHPNLLESK